MFSPYICLSVCTFFGVPSRFAGRCASVKFLGFARKGMGKIIKSVFNPWRMLYLGLFGGGDHGLGEQVVDNIVGDGLALGHEAVQLK